LLAFVGPLENNMRTKLIQLLRNRPLCHPSRIVSATITEPHDLHVRVSGYPWWSDQADRTRDHEIAFTFGGLGDGTLQLPDLHFEELEGLEVFSVEEAINVPWAQPTGYAIYCNAALPRPMNIYMTVHDFLVSQGAFCGAEQFLNCGGAGLLKSFVEITQSTSYLLGSMPSALRDLVCNELDAQRVSHNELTTRLRRSELLATIGGSQFFCETAEAEFQD
jgi:hypothetical protein